MFRIAVCDDDLSFLENAAEMIENWSKQSGIPVEIFTYDNGDELLAGDMSVHPDIIFLDIIMPLFSGMDTAKELRERDTAAQIIFMTSSPEFALESYEVKAQDYILKPVSCERIKKVLDECVASFEAEPKNLVFKTSFGYQKLYIHDIEYVEAQNKGVVFYLRTGESVEANEPLHSIEERLEGSNSFFKCHRSYFVYMPNVNRFNGTKIITKTGRNVPIARGCAKAFKEAYFSMMFKK